MKTALFVLIHSPLVGPITWQPVADELRRSQFDVIVPPLTCPAEMKDTYWQHHVRQVTAALADVPRDRWMVLVGHSGAGPLLPAIRRGVQQRVVGYVFVDCDLPKGGASRLDLFDTPGQAAAFRSKAKDGRLPPWNDVMLRAQIHDSEMRQKFATQLRPMPLQVYEEPIPVSDDWPGAPCAYLSFTNSYRRAVKSAREKRWLFERLAGTHMHMLNDPKSVAETLQKVAARLAQRQSRE